MIIELQPEDGGGDEVACTTEANLDLWSFQFDVSFDNTNENERFNNGQGMISEVLVDYSVVF